MANHTEFTVEYQQTSRALLIVLLAAFFYLYEFCLQVAPSVMTHDLMRDLGMQAASLGVVSGFYYVSYTAMQIPAGILYDRFGPRRMITYAICVCAIGAYLFGSTHTMSTAAAGRFFMGFGSAFSYIGVLVLTARWFKPRYFALIAGIAQSMSSVGAISGQIPLSYFVSTFGWRQTMIALAFIGFISAIVIWLIVRDAPAGFAQQQSSELGKQWQNLKKILSNSRNWLVALYGFGVWAPVVAYAALWGIPFLMEKYQISTLQASTMVAMIWVGIGVGSPLVGWWSDEIKSRRLPLHLCAILGVVVSIGILFIPNLPMPLIYVLLFLSGVASAGQSVSFAVVKENNPLRLVGTASGLQNMAIVAGGLICQPLIGFILHFSHPYTYRGGIPVYKIAAYQHGLAVVPICFAMALIASFFIKETYGLKRKTS